MLYDINITFVESDNLTKYRLRSQCRFAPVEDGSYAVDEYCIEPDGFNVWETDFVEDRFHNDTSAMHLFWTSHYAERYPEYDPHDTVGQIPDGVRGMEGHTGSPTQVDLIEESGRTPHGAVMYDDNISNSAQKHRVLMEEIGHGLGAGYADDKILGVGECYSGGDCYGATYGTIKVENTTFVTPVTIGKGQDRTPEFVFLGGLRQSVWSVMSTGPRDTMNGHYPFSLEELSTVDMEGVPSRDD